MPTYVRGHVPCSSPTHLSISIQLLSDFRLFHHFFTLPIATMPRRQKWAGPGNSPKSLHDSSALAFDLRHVHIRFEIKISQTLPLAKSLALPQAPTSKNSKSGHGPAIFHDAIRQKLGEGRIKRLRPTRVDSKPMWHFEVFVDRSGRD